MFFLLQESSTQTTSSSEMLLCGTDSPEVAFPIAMILISSSVGSMVNYGTYPHDMHFLFLLQTCNNLNQ